MNRRVLAVVLTASVVLNLAAIGWVAWIVADPSYWFPGAYETPKAGPTGETGRSGARGPAGPRGPRGFPGAAGESADEFEIEQLRSDLDEATAQVEAICDELFFQGEVEPLRQIWLNAC